MRIDKEKLAKKLEDLAKELSIDEISKDISNAIMFLSIYCGQNTVKIEDVQFKDVAGQKFSINSYDDTQTLEVLISKFNLVIEKKTENDFNYYLVEYVFDKNGNFTRKAKQKSMPLDKELDIEEKSEGNVEVGTYYSEFKEKRENINLVSLKVPDKNRVENIYYCYFNNPEYKIFCKLPSDFKKLPVINVFGMTEIVDMISLEGIKFEDEKLFNSLVKASKTYYKK